MHASVDWGKEYRDTETVFKEKHGVWDPMPKFTITHLLTVNSVVVNPPPLQRERGGMGKISPIDLYLSANSKTLNRKRERGRGKS